MQKKQCKKWRLHKRLLSLSPTSALFPLGIVYNVAPRGTAGRNFNGYWAFSSITNSVGVADRRLIVVSDVSSITMSSPKPSWRYVIKSVLVGSRRSPVSTKRKIDDKKSTKRASSKWFPTIRGIPISMYFNPRKPFLLSS